MASSSSSAQRVDALAAQAFRMRIEGRPAEAATQYALALEALGHHSSMRSARADLLSDYGIALNQAGQREKAFDAYESCLALNPTHGQAYNNRQWHCKSTARLIDPLRCMLQRCTSAAHHCQHRCRSTRCAACSTVRAGAHGRY